MEILQGIVNTTGSTYNKFLNKYMQFPLFGFNRDFCWVYSVLVLVVFYVISTLEGYLMPNPLCTNILYIYDLVWLCFISYQPLKVI